MASKKVNKYIRIDQFKIVELDIKEDCYVAFMKCYETFFEEIKTKKQYLAVLETLSEKKMTKLFQELSKNGVAVIDDVKNNMLQILTDVGNKLPATFDDIEFIQY